MAQAYGVPPMGGMGGTSSFGPGAAVGAQSPRTGMKRKAGASNLGDAVATDLLAGSGAIETDIDVEQVTIMPLGSGNEVGRSCHIIRFKGKTIMLDCGVHPAYHGQACLPYLDEINLDEVDLLLVSHFHLDHIAGLPYLLKNPDFKAKVYMTHPTKSVYKLIVQDYVKVSTISVEETLYTEQDLLNSMGRIDVINYHQVVHHKGIKFWCYGAGHVLGAAMFMIEIAGVRILYTGDYSRSEDRHLMAAEIPEVKPDILIIESTYGVQTHQPVDKRETRLRNLVYNIVHRRRGRCLIPVFALGRAQELLLILDEYWEANPSLHEVPIYYAGALASKCMKVYQTYTNMMNKHIRNRAQLSNPFLFKHVTNLKSIEQLDDSGPCVVMASPGMLQNGLSRELFDLWCDNKKNGVVIPGYVVDGTLAADLRTEPEEITTLKGLKVPVRCQVDYESFSAHADFDETSDFIRQLRPDHVILVHGEANAMARLQTALQREYSDGSVRISTPQNTQQVLIGLRVKKIAKIVGKLAENKPEDGALVSGVVVRKDYNYHVLDPTDLSEFTSLAAVSVLQKITVPFTGTHASLEAVLKTVYSIELQNAESDSPTEESTQKPQPSPTKVAADSKTTVKAQDMGPVIRVLDAIDVYVRRSDVTPKADTEEMSDEKKESESTAAQPLPPGIADHIVLEWASNPVNDMLADSIVALVMNVQVSPAIAKLSNPEPHSHDHAHDHAHDHEHNHDGDHGETLRAALSEHFDSVDWVESKSDVQADSMAMDDGVETKHITTNSGKSLIVRIGRPGAQQTAIVNPTNLHTSSTDPALEARVTRIASRVRSAILPLTLMKASDDEEREGGEKAGTAQEQQDETPLPEDDAEPMQTVKNEDIAGPSSMDVETGTEPVESVTRTSGRRRGFGQQPASGKS